MTDISNNMPPARKVSQRRPVTKTVAGTRPTPACVLRLDLPDTRLTISPETGATIVKVEKLDPDFLMRALTAMNLDTGADRPNLPAVIDLTGWLV